MWLVTCVTNSGLTQYTREFLDLATALLPFHSHDPFHSPYYPLAVPSVPLLSHPLIFTLLHLTVIHSPLVLSLPFYQCNLYLGQKRCCTWNKATLQESSTGLCVSFSPPQGLKINIWRPIFSSTPSLGQRKYERKRDGKFSTPVGG